MIGEKIAILDLGTYKLKSLIISLDDNNYYPSSCKIFNFFCWFKKRKCSRY